MPDQGHEPEKIPAESPRSISDPNTDHEIPEDETVDKPVMVTGSFYRANPDDMSSDAPIGNSSIAERMARGEHADSLVESAHNSMAHYTEAIRNNAMNNRNRYR